MPTYSNSAFAPLPEVAIPAKPAYFFGSLPVTTQDTQVMRISNVALTSNVATVVGTIFQGNIPAVGNFISIIGTTSDRRCVQRQSGNDCRGDGNGFDSGVYTITLR